MTASVEVSESLIAPETSETIVGGAPEGFDAWLLARATVSGDDVLFVASDDVSMANKIAALNFFAPDVAKLEFPAWDCLPYDRVSPQAEIVSQRIDTLTRLIDSPNASGRIVLTTVSALLQRVPSRDAFADATLRAQPGQSLDRAELTEFLAKYGYIHAQTVFEPGEFAVRGSIIDVFPTGAKAPLRLDFFGDELEAVRVFNAADQRTVPDEERQRYGVTLKPVSEVPLTEGAVSRFRTQYRILFGTAGDDDPLYEAVSASRRHIGMEHWLPLFYDKLETLFDYLPKAGLFLDHQTDEARDARLKMINEYFSARQDFAKTSNPTATNSPTYRPVPTETLYLDGGEWNRLLGQRRVTRFSPFTVPDSAGHVDDAGGKLGRDFSNVRVRPDANVFDAVQAHIKEQSGVGRRVVVAAYTEGSRQRLKGLLTEHGIPNLHNVATWVEAEALPAGAVALAVIALETGFASPECALITEQDILGDRLNRPARNRIRAENFIAEASSLIQGDLVVHVEHGIGQFDGLQTIEVGGAPHDCLGLLYADGNKLFLPVENIEIISRYGSNEAGAPRDRLGAASWQSRKAQLKVRIRDMAGKLIKVAAARTLRPGIRISASDGLYEEFCARFPYTETEDQSRAITETMADLDSGHSVDRLICGDVGFGKTEVALRAAFAAVLESKQVAFVVPTTLLCRQHYLNFRERLNGFPVRIEQVSRLVAGKRVKEIKQELADGAVDIVVGTHALLAKDVRFRDLGLLVVDEEQHFGVAHKERLKQFKADVHVLTLSATPIPRTLQLALTGIREMSFIATPPIDRLAVRTFVMPHDPVVIREAILRERFRGGQTFYVCPRVADLFKLEEPLKALVPEVKITVAHGRMAAKSLEATISQFYDRAFDVLLSTNIIEAGLDLPTVNTIVIHRADMFGLSQLYQLRGRVGRSKIRAYAYLTLPPKQKLTATASKRLEVMQSLDTLGAGFSLASHDLEIRGAGNLLGEEQSGHIREVGIELYRQMLEEAVAEARGLGGIGDDVGEWSPQIAIGMPVLIPDAYVSDLTVRMGLYRRLALLTDRHEIDAFAAELFDRFGPLPDETENLLETIALKALCRQAGVEKLEAGPKGAVVSFHKMNFANPPGLVDFLTAQNGTARLRPDHKLVFMRNWQTASERFDGVRYLMKELASIAAG